MSREDLKELNKKYGNSPLFQIILRDYLKTLQTERKERKKVVYG